MNGTIYEEATWYDIERNKMHLRKDGESYVADAMLLRESINLRQENESLKKENDGLRREIDRLVMNSTPTATELRRVRAEWKKDRTENDKLRELIRTVWLAGDFRSFLGVEEIKERMRELGIEVDG